jgi:hypothetical protein
MLGFQEKDCLGGVFLSLYEGVWHSVTSEEPAMKKKAPARAEEFQATFAALRKILRKYEPKLIVQDDTSRKYYLNTSKLQNKHPVMFAAAIVNKNYVSYHLMPVYGCPALLEGMSDSLKKRMQGKACFNFTTIEATVLEELTDLTERAFRGFRKAGWV